MAIIRLTVSPSGVVARIQGIKSSRKAKSLSDRYARDPRSQQRLVSHRFDAAAIHENGWTITPQGFSIFAARQVHAAPPLALENVLETWLMR
jgi:hypothetical protein